MNARQRRKAFRAGRNLLADKTPVRFTLRGTHGMQFRGHVYSVDSEGRMYAWSERLAQVHGQRIAPVMLHRLRLEQRDE